jgi:hypothetical protein
MSLPSRNLDFPEHPLSDKRLYPPNRRRGDPRRQRPPNNLEAPGMPTKGRP